MQSVERPYNCREAFTREGDQVFSNRYYSSEQNRAQYLSRDVEEDIRLKIWKQMSGFFSKEIQLVPQFRPLVFF